MKFNRHNPEKYDDLIRLRHYGTDRYTSFKSGMIIMTDCIQYLLTQSPRWGIKYNGGVYIDIMCGNSPDAEIMNICFGYESYGVDILPIENKIHKNFILGDVVEKETWDKLPEAKIITCNAAIALIPIEEREKVYKYIYDKLGLYNYFIYSPVELIGGYGIDRRTETKRIESVGFKFRGGHKMALAFQKEL